MKNRSGTIWLRAGMAAMVVAAVVIVAGIHYIHTHIPKEIIPDIKAAISARGIADPDERFKKYMESRYGSMDVAAHREKAFEDYFNRDHIKAMQLIVKHSPPDQRRANIRASANWLDNYRQAMSAQEKADLADYFQSDEGRAALSAATAQFMSQDAEYRSSTTPVVNQLMTTLSTIKQ